MLKLVESQEVINEEFDGRIELIKQLIPLGLRKAVSRGGSRRPLPKDYKNYLKEI